MKKHVIFERHALKEIHMFPRAVQVKLASFIAELEERGELQYPDTKKLQSTYNLFEVRIKYKGEWRVLYAYIVKESIIILSAFHKKTQKTPSEEINKAKKRLQMFQEAR